MRKSHLSKRTFHSSRDYTFFFKLPINLWVFLQKFYFFIQMWEVENYFVAKKPQSHILHIKLFNLFFYSLNRRPYSKKKKCFYSGKVWVQKKKNSNWIYLNVQQFFTSHPGKKKYIFLNDKAKYVCAVWPLMLDINFKWRSRWTCETGSNCYYNFDR